MSMLPLPIVWPYALGFWLVYAWAFWPQLRKLKQAQSLSRDQDAGSLRLLLIGGRLSEVAAAILALSCPGAALTSPRVFLFAGTALLIAGSMLRRHCIRTLGSSFTSAVVVTPEQRVVEQGMYRWVRHPSYAGGMMMMVGVGLAWGNWMSLLVVIISTSLLYRYRVIVEERALVAVLGDDYRRYMERTKRFIPFVV